MVKFSLKRFCRGNSKLNGGAVVVNESKCGGGQIKWELRPGGMLVQRREDGGSLGGDLIKVRVSTVSRWHDISIEPTSTFGDMKMVMSLMTGLEPREQRLLYKGKERGNGDYLHMVGVKDMDKVLLLADPASEERKRRALTVPGDQAVGNSCIICV